MFSMRRASVRNSSLRVHANVTEWVRVAPRVAVAPELQSLSNIERYIVPTFLLVSLLVIIAAFAVIIGIARSSIHFPLLSLLFRESRGSRMVRAVENPFLLGLRRRRNESACVRSILLLVSFVALVSAETPWSLPAASSSRV